MLVQKRAFTLLELSLVVLIISILVVGSMTASISTVNKAKYKTTKERLDVIYKSLGNYFLANGALPCPAPINVVDSDNGYGIAGSTVGVCSSSGVDVFEGGTNLVYGMIPIQELNLPVEMAKDGFGTKFTYVVNADFTDPSDAVFIGNDLGNITINEVVSGGNQTITSNAVFVILSYGENKFGGFNSNNSSENAAASDTSEQSNYATSFNATSNPATATFDNVFVSKSINSEDFDDVLFFKTRNQIVSDFNAYDKILCEGSAGNIIDSSCDGGTCTWADSRYNQIVISDVACASGYLKSVANPTRRCGAFGDWDDGFIDPCSQ